MLSDGVQALDTRIEDAMHSTPRTCSSTDKAINAMLVRSISSFLLQPQRMLRTARSGTAGQECV